MQENTVPQQDPKPLDLEALKAWTDENIKTANVQKAEGATGQEIEDNLTVKLVNFVEQFDDGWGAISKMLDLPFVNMLQAAALRVAARHFIRWRYAVIKMLEAI